ncbi:hypothetical protein CPB86DRAFT_799866 [Serendipita vermifera]|nr:hypothetical protein CPB86DRAFT_799866 [Serendipita vermifera]
MNCVLSHPYGTALSRENLAKVELQQQLPQKIQGLEAALVQTREVYEAEHLQVAPVNGLPTEVLSDIFFLVSNEGGDHRTMAKIPLAVRPRSAWYKGNGVANSHRWRNVLNNTARLWTQITVELDNDVPRSRKQCERAKFYAERSKKLKLDVEIDLAWIKSVKYEVEKLIERTYFLPNRVQSIFDEDDDGSTDYDEAFLHIY